MEESLEVPHAVNPRLHARARGRRGQPSAATAAGSGQSTAPATAGRSHLTAAQIGALPWAQQNKLLTPLRAIANAVGQVGRTSGANIYCDLVIDAPGGVVKLYVTDVHAAGRLIAEAKKIDSSIDTSRLVVKTAPYTKAALDAAADKLVAAQIAHSLPYQLFSVAPALDGSALTVTVADPAAANKAVSTQRAKALTSSAAGAIPVTFVQGTKPAAASWADVKWHDGSPQIPGDVLTPDGHEYCTAGIGAVRTSDNVPVMVTADHCFAEGTAVYTGAGSTGAFGNGQKGNYVGTVTSDYSYFDAEGLTGGNNNSDESDTSGWIPVTSYSYSYNGDYVCQDGALSFFQGAGTVCGIVVDNQDTNWVLTYRAQDHGVRGVTGHQTNGIWAVSQGDSGGAVFTISGSNSRQSRGIVSALSGSCTGISNGAYYGCSELSWVETTDIFNHLGLKLNPTT